MGSKHSMHLKRYSNWNLNDSIGWKTIANSKSISKSYSTNSGWNCSKMIDLMMMDYSHCWMMGLMTTCWILTG